MRKKIFQFTTIATILLLGACSNEAQVHETNPIKGRTISLTASIPDDEPSTRVNLNQQVKNISITWVVGDQLQLAFVQGTSKIKENVTVTSISNNGKKAHFNIPIPDGWKGQFKLYGVYGGGGIDINGPNPVAILPTNSGSASTLAALKNDVMLYFENDMQTTDTQSSVVFKHLGSIFSITLGNINQNAIDFIKQNEVNEARIKGVNLDVN